MGGRAIPILSAGIAALLRLAARPAKALQLP
jgi:hypothetical protein